MSYFGSKTSSGIAQAIIALMPPHDIYIETHLGSGAIMKAKPATIKQIGIDKSAAAIAAFNYTAGQIELHNSDCLTMLANFDYTAGRTLIYADPPYVLSTRGKDRYEYDYTDQDHIDLLAMLDQIPASVILSGYPSQLYQDLIPHWHTKELQVMTRGGVRTEKLWFNFDPAAQSFTAMHAGKNFTDRQRIQRKAQRWAKSFRSMPAGEQLAILHALLVPHSQEHLQDPELSMQDPAQLELSIGSRIQ